MESKDFLDEPELEQRLDRLFASYREACPAPEFGPNFMPALWQAIDSRRSFALTFGRWARGLVAAAAAFAMLMAVFVALPRGQTSPVYLASYVDVLDDDNRTDNPDFVEAHHLEGSGGHSIQ